MRGGGFQEAGAVRTEAEMHVKRHKTECKQDVGKEDEESEEEFGRR